MTPCMENPGRWSSGSRRQLGMAMHACLSHCVRFVECHRTAERVAGTIVAGVLYAGDPPHPDGRVLTEVACGQCLADAPKRMPGAPSDTGACGTTKGYHRHTRAGERACDGCRLAKQAYERDRYRAAVRRAAA